MLDFGGTPLEISVKEDDFASPEMILNAVQQQTGLSAALLRIASPGMIEVEYLEGQTPPLARWRRAAMEPPSEARAAWQRPGWFLSTSAQMFSTLESLGLQTCGWPVQERHNAVTGMIAVSAAGQRIRLKTGLPMFSHEAEVIRGLRLYPEAYVPEVVFQTPEWWLSAEFPFAKSHPTESRMAALARLQVQVANSGKVAGLGCETRSLPEIANTIRALIAEGAVPDTVRLHLDHGLGRLAVLCEQVEELSIPASIVHGDFTPNNARWTGSRWFLYDWTDACIAHPLIDLSHTIWESDPRSRAAEIGDFARIWSRVLNAATLYAALDAAPTTSAAFQTANYAGIVAAVGLTDNEEPSANELSQELERWCWRLARSLDTLPS